MRWIGEINAQIKIPSLLGKDLQYSEIPEVVPVDVERPLEVMQLRPAPGVAFALLALVQVGHPDLGLDVEIGVQHGELGRLGSFSPVEVPHGGVLLGEQGVHHEGVHLEEGRELEEPRERLEGGVRASENGELVADLETSTYL